MTHPFNPAGDGQPAGPAPDATAAPGRAAGPAGPGVPLSIWPGLPEPGGTRERRAGHRRSRPPGHRHVLRSRRPGRRRRRLLAGGRRGRGSRRAARPRPRPRRAGSGYPLPVPYPVARLRPGGPALVLAPGNPVTGQAALAVAGCCARLPGASGQDGQDAGLLFAACERVLRPGGVLAVIAGPAAPGGTLTDTAGSVVAAARAAGLVYAQHIVLVRAEIDGDRLAPAAPARPAAARCTTTCWCSPSPEEKPAHDNRPPRARPAPESRPR